MPSLHTFLTPKNSTGRGAHPSLWRGTVAHATPTSVHVNIAGFPEALLATTTLPQDLIPGERVIIGAVEGRIDHLVVLAAESPTIAAHTHPDTDVAYPGWEALTLTPAWAGATAPGAYAGLRYRTDARNVHIHGTITPTADEAPAGTITTLPARARPAWSTPVPLTQGSAGTTLATLNPDGTITTAMNTAHFAHQVNVIAPLT